MTAIGSLEQPRAPEGDAEPREAVPLRPVALMASILGIAGAAVCFCCAIAAVAMTGYVGIHGREATTDFLQELHFDGPLRTQLGALVVSVLYLGLALATLTAARLRGRRRWAVLVALGPVRNRIEIAVIAAATLCYAGVSTVLVEQARTHRVLVSGPTDMPLLVTIVANLVLLAPIAEELLFRGWLYTGLRRALSFWPSFLATLALFAAIHGEQDPRRIVQVLPLAVALGLLRERAGGIKPTIALHGAYNLLIVAIRLAYT